MVPPILKLPPLLLLLLLPLPLPTIAQLQFEFPIIPVPTPTPSIDPIPQLPTPTPPNPRTTHKKMVREFLRTHNAVRNTIGEQPYVWDRKIARQARRWSDERRGDCALVHSGHPDYGENMFWGGGSDWKAGDAVKFWADEHQYYDPGSNSCEFGKVCGHFTQMVWNTSVRVGCGRAECFDGGVIITCNYFPPGNWMGERPF